MNDKETIKNKFIHFEPEVDDLAINQNWEKIKYFVPQKERKKRGAFFILSIGAALFIAGLIGTLFYKPFAKDSVVYKKTKAQPKVKTTNKSISENTSQQNEVAQNSNARKKQYKRSIHGTIASGCKTIKLNAKEQIFKNYNDLTLPTRQKQNYDLVTDTISKKNLFADILQRLQIPSFATEGMREIYPEFKNAYNSQNLVSALSIDVFGGSVLSYKRRVQHMDFKQKNKDIGCLAGISINYLLQNKFTVCGQFIFDKANLNYSYITSQNKITKQVISISSSPASAQFDSTYYIKAFTDYNIRANYSCYFALGAEYLLLQKNKLSISASALFNVCYTKYNHGYAQYYGDEVFLYIKGQPDPPSSNIVPSYFKEGDNFKTTEVVNLGALPGAVISYSLNNKIFVIFKPCYFIGFSKNKLLINSSSYALNEDRLFINAGLRFKL